MLRRQYEQELAKDQAYLRKNVSNRGAQNIYISNANMKRNKEEAKAMSKLHKRGLGHGQMEGLGHGVVVVETKKSKLFNSKNRDAVQWRSPEDILNLNMNQRIRVKRKNADEVMHNYQFKRKLQDMEEADARDRFGIHDWCTASLSFSQFDSDQTGFEGQKHSHQLIDESSDSEYFIDREQMQKSAESLISRSVRDENVEMFRDKERHTMVGRPEAVPRKTFGNSTANTGKKRIKKKEKEVTEKVENYLKPGYVPRKELAHLNKRGSLIILSQTEISNINSEISR